MSTAYDEIKTRLQGSMVALVTPMHPDGTVDYKRLADLIDWQIEQGTHCLVAVGTTGESATLSMQEHSDVIRYFVQHVKGRVPVIAGTGANNTMEAIKLTQDAADAGADCALVVLITISRHKKACFSIIKPLLKPSIFLRCSIMYRVARSSILPTRRSNVC